MVLRLGPVSLVFVLLALVAPLPAAAEEEGPAAAAPELVFDLAWVEGRRRDYQYRVTTLSAKAPDGVTAPAEAKKPHYARVAFGAERTLLLAIDIEKEASRLWVDTDLDGDLRDEAVVAFDLRGRVRWAETTIALPTPDGGATRPIDVAFSQATQDIGKRCSYAFFAHREGVVVLEGRLRQILLRDANGDLRFDDASDAILLDVNGDGRLNRTTRGGERIRGGVPFRIRDAGYRMRLVDPTAARIAFTRLEEAPPAPPPTWTPKSKPRAGVARRQKGISLEDVKRQYEALRKDQSGSPFPLAWGVRRLITRVGSLGTKEAFEFLYRVYREQDDDVIRRNVVEAMGNAHYVAFASKVAKIARAYRAPGVQVAAIRTLHAMGAPNRYKTYLSLVKRSRDDHVFGEAVRYLAFTDRPEGRKALADLLAKRSRPDRQRFIYEAATRYASVPPSVEIVTAAAESRDPGLKALALEDARRIDASLAHRLALDAAPAALEHDPLRVLVIEILGSWGGADAVEALVPLATGADPPVHDRLVELLRLERDVASIQRLVASLDDRNPYARALAAAVLAEIQGEAITVALTERLRREGHDLVILALLEALCGKRTPAAVEPAIVAARRHPTNGEIQEAALRVLADIGFGHEAATRFLTDQARSSAWVDRVMALEAAGESHPSPVVIAVLLDGLEDALPPVRVAAARGLGRLRARETVLSMIDRLEDEKDERVKHALAAALYRTTGQSLYDVAERWRRWWADHGADFEVPAEVPQAPPKLRGHTVASFYGVPVQSDRIVFVIDRSGSMSSIAFVAPPTRRGQPPTRRGQPPPEALRKSRLDLAVEETLKVVSKLGSWARVNVILFESNVHPWKRSMVSMGRSARAQLKTFLESQGPTGGTNLYDALEEALETRGVEAVYLLSDGMPHSGQFVATDDIVREVKRILRKKPVVIHCVAVGHDSGLLKRLAEVSGGAYVQR